MMLSTARKLHFVGIGGVGMCALAEILIHDGWQVSGCDAAPSERTERLESLGAVISIGHDRAHLDDVDLVVATAAVPRAIDEFAAARERGIPIARRSAVLGEVMHGKVGVAVAGTHGKTTTTAIIGRMLEGSGLDPTVIAGGRLLWIDSHARIGRSEYVVCEADEFDRAFLDLYPTFAVVTNVEAEHLECYGSAENLHRAFHEFASRVPSSGAVIACIDDPGARALASGLDVRVVGYGCSEQAEIRATAVVPDADGMNFDVVARGRNLGRVRLSLPGEHNMRNALAGIAVGLELGAPFASLAEACADFSGVARRFEILGERDGIIVVDDYAHHPTELESALHAARQSFPDKRLVAVFQPHLFSRTRDFAGEFARVLGAADVVVVLPIYGAREKPIDGVSSDLVVDALSGGAEIVELEDDVRTVAMLRRVTAPGDVLLTLGAGDVNQVAFDFLEAAS